MNSVISLVLFVLVQIILSEEISNESNEIIEEMTIDQVQTVEGFMRTKEFKVRGRVKHGVPKQIVPTFSEMLFMFWTHCSVKNLWISVSFVFKSDKCMDDNQLHFVYINCNMFYSIAIII